MSERKVIVASRVGLHARPASIFAEAVAQRPIEVTIALDGQPADDAVDASSILSLMSLGAGNGDVVILRAEGAGADEALESLAKILETDLDAE
jgi:phosphocarrier protein